MLTWQYIAGFFDGEGCICFAKYSHVNLKYGNLKSRHIIIHIGQHEKQANVIYEIKKFLESYNLLCRLSKYKTFNPKTGEKLNTYQIRLSISSMGTCKEFLELVLPYLIVKKEKAQLAIDFINANPKGLKYTKNQKLKIRELFDSGMSRLKVAENTNIPYRAVNKIIREKIYG